MDRLDREREFHDRTFQEGARRSADRFYELSRLGFTFYERAIESRAANARVLEYGCGPGSYAFSLARLGANVVGIDISDVAIERAQTRAQMEGLQSRVHFRTMDAEALEFSDGTFDLVCGTGILHHLDLERAYQEVARVLTSDGSAVFLEPLAHNPFINLYRSLTPRQRTEDEHPLAIGDVRAAENYFGDVELQFFHLFSLLAIPFAGRRPLPALIRLLDRVDVALFRAVPSIRRYAWMVALLLSKPRRSEITDASASDG